MTIAVTSPAEVKARLASGETIFLLDVREDDEVAEWTYPTYVHIPLGELGARIGELPKDRQILCACRSGGRSMKAAALLDEAGYDVVNLDGGALAWMQDSE
ncbi:MAG: rhodanese-like domain-containing protein [Actinomycetota bacterium]